MAHANLDGTANLTQPQLPTLYVGNLAPEVSEEVLFRKFTPVGQVISIRVCRDQTSGRSLGYAYVNFEKLADAVRALEELNFDMINDRQMRLMWCQRNPTLRRSAVGNIFIKNLNKTITDNAIHDTFAAFGNILSCEVAKDMAGNSKGYAFVHFETEASANTAIEKVNGMLLIDKKVYVGKFIPQVIRQRDLPEKIYSNVYVKNLGEDVNDEKLKEMFESFGEITSHRVVVNENDGRSKGFGFVAFASPDHAKAACDELNGKELPNGKILFVGPAQRKDERQKELKHELGEFKRQRQEQTQGTNLYVKNIDSTIDEEDFRKHFSRFGTITSVKVMKEGDVSKGFGFVSFSSAEEASRAITEVNGTMFKTKPLHVSLAQSKEDRRALLAAQRLRYVNPVQQMFSSKPIGAFSVPQPQNYFGQQATPRWVPQPSVQGANAQLSSLSNVLRPIVNGPQSRPGPSRNVNYHQPPRNIQINPISVQRMPHPRSQAPPAIHNNVVQNHIQLAPQIPPVHNQQAQQMAPQPQPQPQIPKPAVKESWSKRIENVPELERKQFLGEDLFRMVAAIEPELAGKITGMLLELSNSDIIIYMEDPAQLRSKVEDALSILAVNAAKEKP